LWTSFVVTVGCHDSITNCRSASLPSRRALRPEQDIA
jgi:hypothetical protein